MGAMTGEPAVPARMRSRNAERDSAAQIPFGSAVWTPSRKELWQRIEAHDFEPDTPLSFTKRLARDRGWSLDEARAAIAGYRRFCFLAAISDEPMTPSETVDEVWHQHLIYSRDYWDVWCKEVLRAPLHHDPTPGGREAQIRFRRQYAETMALHERFFGPPDPKLWPATYVRFGKRPQYFVADLHRSLILPRPGALLRRFLQG
jgi:hypothetical protein